MFFYRNWKKIRKFSIFDPKFWRLIKVQIHFLFDSQFFPTFCDMFIVEQLLLFHLRYTDVLGSLRAESKIEITKKLRENRKFWTEKYGFRFFKNCFLDLWIKLYNLQTKVFGQAGVFWKPYFRHWHPYSWRALIHSKVLK